MAKQLPQLMVKPTTDVLLNGHGVKLPCNKSFFALLASFPKLTQTLLINYESLIYGLTLLLTSSYNLN